MKKVFKIETKEIKSKLIKMTDEYFVFAKDISEAIKKALDCMDDRMQVINAELFCIVEEDRDLKKYGDESKND